MYMRVCIACVCVCVCVCVCLCVNIHDHSIIGGLFADDLVEVHVCTQVACLEPHNLIKPTHTHNHTHPQME